MQAPVHNRLLGREKALRNRPQGSLRPGRGARLARAAPPAPERLRGLVRDGRVRTVPARDVRLPRGLQNVFPVCSGQKGAQESERLRKANEETGARRQRGNAAVLFEPPSEVGRRARSLHCPRRHSGPRSPAAQRGKGRPAGLPKREREGLSPLRAEGRPGNQSPRRRPALAREHRAPVLVLPGGHPSLERRPAGRSRNRRASQGTRRPNRRRCPGPGSRAAAA